MEATVKQFFSSAIMVISLFVVRRFASGWVRDFFGGNEMGPWKQWEN